MSPLLSPVRVADWAGRAARWLSSGAAAGLTTPLTRLHPALDAAARYAAFLELPAEPAAPPRSRPLVSLLMPVFEAHEPSLRLALDSVLRQSYSEWELCVADAGPRGAPGSRLLADAARADPRIRVLPLASNGGIASNTNAALAAARGAFVAAFDQDDLLDGDALLRMAAALDGTPHADLVYSDMDNITPGGLRYSPFFKPDWSPELLLSGNYLAHLTLLRRALVVEAGGFDPALDGAQDWDLVLRLAERPLRVVHVPHVLYHWRALPTSAASGLAAKPYVREAQRRAVQSALDRRGIEARVSHDTRGAIEITTRPDMREPEGLVHVADRRLEPDEATWRELSLWAADPQIGAAGALLVRPDGRIASAGFVDSDAGALNLFAGASSRRFTPLGWPCWLRNVTAPAPLAFAARREVVERFGPVEATVEGALAFGRRLADAGLRCVTVGAAALACPEEVPLPDLVPGGGTGVGFSPNLEPDAPATIPRSAARGSSRFRSR